PEGGHVPVLTDRQRSPRISASQALPALPRPQGSARGAAASAAGAAAGSGARGGAGEPADLLPAAADALELAAEPLVLGFQRAVLAQQLRDHVGSLRDQLVEALVGGSASAPNRHWCMILAAASVTRPSLTVPP